MSHSGRRNRSSSLQLRLQKSDWWWNKATQITEQLSHTAFMCCIPANHNHEPLFIGVTLDTNLICIDRFLVVIQNLSSPNQQCLSHAPEWLNSFGEVVIQLLWLYFTETIHYVFFLELCSLFTLPLGYFHSELTAIGQLSSSFTDVRYVGPGVQLYHFFSALRKPQNSNIQEINFQCHLKNTVFSTSFM